MIEAVMSACTAIVTYIFAELAKKFNITESNYIPAQNFCIGILAGIMIWVLGIYDNLATSVVLCILSAFGAGGIYDAYKKIKGGNNSDIVE